MAAGKSIARVNWSSHIDCVEARGLAQLFPGEADYLAIPADHQRTLRSLLLTDGRCPYCSEPLSIEHEREAQLSTGVREVLVICHSCGFWRMETEDSVLGRFVRVPYARGFQPELQTPALGELARQVQQAPEKIYALGPTQFEVLVGGILGEFFDCEVEHVGRTGDGGIDLVVVDAEDPLLVQVKRRTRSDATEGIEVVKHLFASLFAAGRNRGMLVTSAQRFTRGAQAWVRLPELRDSGYELELVDIARVIEMTRATSTGEDSPWRRFVDGWQEMKLDRSWPDLESRVEGDKLLVASPELAGTVYWFVRADRDCCTVVESKGSTHAAAPKNPGLTTSRPIEGLEFIELIVSWPRQIRNEIFSFFAGPNDEMRIEPNP